VLESRPNGLEAGLFRSHLRESVRAWAREPGDAIAVSRCHERARFVRIMQPWPRRAKDLPCSFSC